MLIILAHFRGHDDSVALAERHRDDHKPRFVPELLLKGKFRNAVTIAIRYVANVLTARKHAPVR